MWLVDLFECMTMHGLTNPKFLIALFIKIANIVDSFRNALVDDKPKDKTPLCMLRSSETTSLLKSKGFEYNCY
jgi:hypothetical protein